jgi:hypothetical protein
MIGVVEIYKTVDGKDELLFSENNIIVNGASEIIADMLSYPITDDIENSPIFSSNLNPSNFSIAAVSFGKSQGVYLSTDKLITAAHYYAPSLSSYYSFPSNPILAHTEPSFLLSGCIRLPSSIVNTNISQNDTKLEPSSTTMAERAVELSSVFSGVVDYGHNKNYMALGKTASSTFLGCYAPSAGCDIQILTPTSGFILSGSVDGAGTYNALGAMDVDGFLKVEYASNTNGYTMAVVKNVNSLGNDITTVAGVASHPAISVEILMPPADVKICHLYGGITTLGLWGIDLTESLNSVGGQTPFPWINNETKKSPRKYKLFAKKSLTKNLLHVEDYDAGGAVNFGFDNLDTLKIKWKINLNNGNYWG